MKYIILIFVIFLGCNKPKIKDYSSFLPLLQAGPSGNCALIEKTISESRSIYKATAKTVSSTGCRESTFFSHTLDPVTAKKSSDSYFNGIILTLGKYNECSELMANFIAQREMFSQDKIIELAVENQEGCTRIGVQNIYCKDAESQTKFKNKFKYVTISNAKNDMSINYNSQVQINETVNLLLDLKYQPGVVGNLRIANNTELSLFNSGENNTVKSTYASNAQCFNKIVTGNTNLKTAYTKIPTLQEFFKEEITVSNRKLVTETITDSLLCHYGDGVVETPQSISSPAIGICPSTYPVY
jgi:hypothetical protein